jgi:hypothetical protein
MQKNTIKTISAMDIHCVNGGNIDLEKIHTVINDPILLHKVIVIGAGLCIIAITAMLQYRSSYHEYKKQQENDKANNKLATEIIKVICAHKTTNITCN